MSNRLIEIFEDKKLIDKIKKRMPYLFQLEKFKNSSAGKTRMEVNLVHKSHYPYYDILIVQNNLENRR